MRFRTLEITLGLLCFTLGLFLIGYDIYEENIQEHENERIEASIEQEEESALEEAEAMSEVASKESAIHIASDEPAAFKYDNPRYKESLKTFLRRNRYDKKEISFIAKAISQYYDIKKIDRKNRFYFKRIRDKESGMLSTVKIIMMFDGAKRKLNLVRDENNNFVAEGAPLKLKKKSIYVQGTIKDSLYRDALKVGLSKYLINKIIQIYSFSIDFQRGVKPGETFEVMYDKTYDEETGYVDDGVVIYAALYIAGGPAKIYLYDAPKGQDYFNEKGEGVRKALLRTPVKGARISSGYGRRRHPILGYTKMHRGVDFAARRGSPILAAGDGVVKKYGRLGGYGNYILVQHNSEYSTAYAHMHKYAKGISRGKRVKQGEVIGYVGATGRATAAHLHYEVHYKGKQINPQKLKMVPHQVLKGKQLEDYVAVRDTTDDVVLSLKKRKR